MKTQKMIIYQENANTNTENKLHLQTQSLRK